MDEGLNLVDFNGISMGFQWISMDFNGFQWISMDFNGFQWISMDYFMNYELVD